MKYSYLEGSSDEEGASEPPTDSPRDFERRFFRADTTSEPPKIQSFTNPISITKQ